MIAFQTKGLLLLLLIALCLITGALAQSGGSRSRSSSRSRSRSRKKTYTNCTTVKGKTVCYDDNDDDDGQGFGFKTILAILFLGGVKGYDYIIKYLQQNQNKEIRENTMNDFITRMGGYPSTLDLGARQEIIGSLKAKSFNMVFTVRARNDPTQCHLKVNSIEKVTDDLYKIKLSGTDEIGRSRLEGNLVFKDDGIAWKLTKDYDSKRQAGQTNGFENLFYEGSGGIARMEGKWAYYGHESNPDLSGTWFMVPA